MKARNPLTPKIKLIHSKWSWHTCSNCGIEFKDVDMWEYSYEDYSINELINCDKYSCTHCSPTKEGAIKNLMSSCDYEYYLKIEKKIKELK